MTSPGRNPEVHIFSPESVVANAAKEIAAKLIAHLKNARENNPSATPKILLLLSGGSSVAMYVEMVKELIKNKEDFGDMSDVIISLGDERLVKRFEPDSNEEQLTDQSVLQLFARLHARFIPWLESGDNTSQGERIATKMSQRFQELINEGARIIILAGAGEHDDPHTLGILSINDKHEMTILTAAHQPLVHAYAVPPDHPNKQKVRATATGSLVRQAHAVLLFATGQKKFETLQTLLNGTPDDAAIKLATILLLRLVRELIIYTDQPVSQPVEHAVAAS
jgi:6-phosphogluconolactonase/glucosamine-6-phosphate isomerase/deaminase